MKTERNTKILEKIKEKKIIPKPKIYFVISEIFHWSFAAAILFLGGISVGSFIFQFYNMSLISPRTGIFFALLRVAIICMSIIFARYYILRTKRGYTQKNKIYIFSALAIAVLVGIILFFSNISGHIEKKIGRAGILAVAKEYWAMPQNGLLAGELYTRNPDGNILIKDFNEAVHVVNIKNINKKQQGIFDDFLRVRMVGYQEDEIFYPCIVAPWEVRRMGKEYHPQYKKIKDGNIQFSKQKRPLQNFKKFFERKDEIVRTNKC